MSRDEAASAAEIASAKALVWERLVTGGSGGSDAAASGPPDPSTFADGVRAEVSAPIGELVGVQAVLDGLYRPLARAMPVARRRPDLFLGGRFEGATWVATTGLLTGRLVEPWCRVPVVGPDGADPGPVAIRYGEFHRVEHGRVVELRVLFDLLGLAAQVGHRLLPPFAGRSGPPPAPALGNGLAVGPQDRDETAFTLQLVEDMIGGCNRLDERGLASMGMSAYWHDDMRWYGPWGVGATHGFDEFQRDAQGPSVASFPDRRGGHHRARIADGVTAAFTGWPSLRGTFNGVAFRGIEPTGGPIGQNIMDFYIRRGDRLHENWVLIDLIDFAAQCGVDLLDGLPTDP